MGNEHKWRVVAYKGGVHNPIKACWIFNHRPWNKI